MSIYGDTGGSDGMADTLSTAAAKPAGGAAAATSGWLHELTIRDIALGCTMLAVLVLIVSGGGAGPPGPPGTGLRARGCPPVCPRGSLLPSPRLRSDPGTTHAYPDTTKIPRKMCLGGQREWCLGTQREWCLGA